MLLITVVIQVLTFAYFQFIRWANLFPFNNVEQIPSNQRMSQNLAYGVLMLIPVFSYGLHLYDAQLISIFIYGILFFSEVLTWWAPYFLTPSENWKDIYSKQYSQTTKIFSSTEGRLVPDLQHIILQVLLLTCFVLSILVYIK